MKLTNTGVPQLGTMHNIHNNSNLHVAAIIIMNVSAVTGLNRTTHDVLF